MQAGRIRIDPDTTAFRWKDRRFRATWRVAAVDSLCAAVMSAAAGVSEAWYGVTGAVIAAATVSGAFAGLLLPGAALAGVLFCLYFLLNTVNVVMFSFMWRMSSANGRIGR